MTEILDLIELFNWLRTMLNDSDLFIAGAFIQTNTERNITNRCIPKRDLDLSLYQVG